jgi:predicted ATPase
MCEIAVQRLPIQLTSFVGRRAQINDVRKLLATNRLVTLTGTGGAGKTRLALQLAAQMAAEFGDDVYYVELAAITEPNTVPVGMARALGLTDVAGRSTLVTLERSIGDRRMLVLIDNCEHLLDASAALLSPLLRTCPNLTVLATSREPIGVAGEVTWRVPPRRGAHNSRSRRDCAG